MSEAVIKLEAVEKTYKMGDVYVQALKGVDLEVKKGEFLAIIGPSGSGKSTMLNSIGALDIPTKGRILLDGVDIAKLDESHLAQIRGRKIGFVFQTFNLIPSLNALNNVMLPMIFQSGDTNKNKARARMLLEEVGLSHRIEHLPSECSGGERQRIAIARALANDPEVILADEPTGNLDSNTGEEIMDLLLELHNKEKKTIILITHDLSLTKYADRIAYLKDGQIQKIRKK